MLPFREFIVKFMAQLPGCIMRQCDHAGCMTLCMGAGNDVHNAFIMMGIWPDMGDDMVHDGVSDVGMGVHDVHDAGHVRHSQAPIMMHAAWSSAPSKKQRRFI